MKKIRLILCVVVCCLSCGSSNKVIGTTMVGGTFPMFSSENIEPFLDITEISADASYGYSEKNPIMLGGEFSNEASNQRRYFASLVGPNDETVRFVRLGSCCGYESENAMLGEMALLDRCQLTYEGLKTPLVFYIS